MNAPRPQLPRTRKGVIFTGAVMLALGIVIVVGAGSITVLLARIAGFAVLAFGLFQLGSTLIRNGGFNDAPLSELLVAGLVLLVGGIIVLFPESFVSALFSLLGIAILLSGVADLLRANEARSMHEPFTTPLVVAIVTILAGIAVTAMPFAAAELAPMACGITLIANGLSELFLAWQMR